MNEVIEEVGSGLNGFPTIEEAKQNVTAAPSAQLAKIPGEVRSLLSRKQDPECVERLEALAALAAAELVRRAELRRSAVDEVMNGVN